MICQDLLNHKARTIRAFFMRFCLHEKNDVKQKQPINPFRNFAPKVARFASTEQLTTKQLKTNKHVR